MRTNYVFLKQCGLIKTTNTLDKAAYNKSWNYYPREPEVPQLEAIIDNY
jgi:hypothetical protein